MILPRVMLLHVGFLAAYEGKEGMHRYVDEQAVSSGRISEAQCEPRADPPRQAHCDDIVLNSLAGYMTGKPPLRIALPPSSITDYTAVCGYAISARRLLLSFRDSWLTFRSPLKPAGPLPHRWPCGPRLSLGFADRVHAPHCRWTRVVACTRIEGGGRLYVD